MSEKIEITPEALQKVLQKFNGDLGMYINGEERFKLGRVLTIIDASIADPEQRKAIKDLVNNEWWGSTNHTVSNDSPMTSPHTDLRAICQLFGFELYAPNSLASPSSENDSLPWVIKRYKQAINN